MPNDGAWVDEEVQALGADLVSPSERLTRPTWLRYLLVPWALAKQRHGRRLTRPHLSDRLSADLELIEAMRFDNLEIESRSCQGDRVLGDGLHAPSDPQAPPAPTARDLFLSIFQDPRLLTTSITASSGSLAKGPLPALTRSRIAADRPSATEELGLAPNGVKSEASKASPDTSAR